MSEVFLDVVLTIACGIFAFFVPLGHRTPTTTGARVLFFLFSFLFVVFSQYLWATTGSGILERTTCSIMPRGKACGPLAHDPVGLFNQVCPAVLADAQELDWVPYAAKLTSLNPQSSRGRRYICRAEARGITYFITGDLRCDDLNNVRCTSTARVETDAGRVIFDIAH